MIELRWIKRPAEKRDGPIFFRDEAMPSKAAYQRVLQYRYRYPEDTDLINSYPPVAWQWSEWQDVPEAAACG